MRRSSEFNGGRMQLSQTFLDHFKPLQDPRVANHNKRHNLEDILVITILATICGADNWIEICEFGEAQKDWLSTFLELPNGIPSHDTFGRVFSLLDPAQFDECFGAWTRSLAIDVQNSVIAIDGKTLRGSGNRRQGQRPLHLVSAWASEHNILLGQVQTFEKSNEITAIPELLKLIDVRGSTVTLDAMGCQHSIAQDIIDRGGNYVLNLKENQPSLLESVKAIVDIGESLQYKKILHRRKIEKIHAHGRIETRRYTLISARDPIAFQIRWPGLKGIGVLDVTRTTNNEVEYSKRYFLTTFAYDQIDAFMKGVREHWNIEIGLHWSLDVSFREDLNQVRIGYAAKNLATVRRIALNLLKQETNIKKGISCKRKKAGWDRAYLLKILASTGDMKTATSLSKQK
jgi:predicted transposase YbfD/YdcC